MSTVIQQIDLALSCTMDEETPAIVVLAEMAAPALVEARAEILRLRAELAAERARPRPKVPPFDNSEFWDGICDDYAIEYGDRAALLDAAESAGFDVTTARKRLEDSNG